MSMDVADAIRIAREWVESYAARNPDFCGAHLMGGIPMLPMTAPFPTASDLDLGIVVESPPKPGQEVFDEFYRGVPIEAGLRSVELYRTSEAVLANPELACNLATDTILADPQGLLGGIQPGVSAGYRRRRWVIARCDAEKQRAGVSFERASSATSPMAFLSDMVFFLTDLAGLIAVAELKQPTHRRSLILLGESLRGRGRGDLFEQAMTVCGLEHLNKSQVMTLLDHTARAFDRAIEVKRTPSPFDFKLRPHLRPYLVDGTLSMIEEGYHREAMPWICMGLYVSTAAIRNDAPPAESAQYDRIWTDCFELLGMTTPRSLMEKLRVGTDVRNSLSTLADQIVARPSDDTR